MFSIKTRRATEAVAYKTLEEAGAQVKLMLLSKVKDGYAVDFRADGRYELTSDDGEAGDEIWIQDLDGNVVSPGTSRGIEAQEATQCPRGLALPRDWREADRQSDASSHSAAPADHCLSRAEWPGNADGVGGRVACASRVAQF